MSNATQSFRKKIASIALNYLTRFPSMNECLPPKAQKDSEIVISIFCRPFDVSTYEYTEDTKVYLFKFKMTSPRCQAPIEGFVLRRCHHESLMNVNIRYPIDMTTSPERYSRCALLTYDTVHRDATHFQYLDIKSTLPRI